MIVRCIDPSTVPSGVFPFWIVTHWKASGIAVVKPSDADAVCWVAVRSNIGRPFKMIHPP